MPPLKFHVMHLAFAADFHFQPLGKRIDHGCADAVQAAADLVGRSGGVLELSTRAELGKNDFDGWNSFFGMNPHRNSPAVIDDRAAAIGVYLDQNTVAET